MIDHISLHVSDFAKAKVFYAAALAPLGYELKASMDEWSVAGFGEGEKADLWIQADGTKQTGHIAFRASNKDTVDAFYKAALAAGATDNGAPGYRKEYAPGYYAAFVRDADGHNIEVVFHDESVKE